MRTPSSRIESFLAKDLHPDGEIEQISARLGTVQVNLLKELTLEELVPHQILIAFDIFTGLDLDETGLNRFVGEALELADDYLRAQA